MEYSYSFYTRKKVVRVYQIGTKNSWLNGGYMNHHQGICPLDPAKGIASWNPVPRGTAPYPCFPEFTFITSRVHPTPPVSVSKQSVIVSISIITTFKHVDNTKMTNIPWHPRQVLVGCQAHQANYTICLQIKRNIMVKRGIDPWGNGCIQSPMQSNRTSVNKLTNYN